MYTYLFILLDLCYPQAETWCHLVSFQGGLASDFSLLDQTTIKLGPGTVEEVNMQEIEKGQKCSLCPLVGVKFKVCSMCKVVFKSMKMNSYIYIFYLLSIIHNAVSISHKKKMKMVKTSTWCRGILICLRSAFTAIWSS